MENKEQPLSERARRYIHEVTKEELRRTFEYEDLKHTLKRLLGREEIMYADTGEPFWVIRIEDIKELFGEELLEEEK